MPYATIPNTKTHKVAVYPDGRRYILRRSEGVWWYDEHAGAHPQAHAIEAVEREGGKVVTEPNPYYQERRRDPLAGLLRWARR